MSMFVESIYMVGYNSGEKMFLYDCTHCVGIVCIVCVSANVCTYFFVSVTSRRATPLGVRAPENINRLTSFLAALSVC